jgi:hypothetical protein
MKNQFWAGLGSRASTVKKKFWPIMSNSLGRLFMLSWSKKIKFYVKFTYF